MIEIVKTQHRDLQWLDVAKATVRVSDPIIGKGNNLAAGFTEYTEPSKLEWTFTYDEVFLLWQARSKCTSKGRIQSPLRSAIWGIFRRARRLRSSCRSMPTFYTSPNRLGAKRPIKLETRITLFDFYKCIHKTPLPVAFRTGSKHGSSVIGRPP